MNVFYQVFAVMILLATGFIIGYVFGVGDPPIDDQDL